MTDEMEEIVSVLRDKGKNAQPAELVEILDGLLGGGGVTAGYFITHFKLAFPQISISVLKKATGAKCILLDGWIELKEFNEMLSPWLPTDPDMNDRQS